MRIRISIQPMAWLAAVSVATFSLLPVQANDEAEKGAVEVQETATDENADEQGAEAAAGGNQPLETRILHIDAAPAGDILTVQAQGEVAAGQLLAQLEGPGKYWIGIHLHEVSPALRSQ